jgi:protein phosphatase
MSLRLRVGGRSDVGMHRQDNQDSMYAGPRLAAVADGVGGAAGGEVASRLTITALMPLDSEPITDPQHALQAAADNADASIRETVAHHGALTGMGTTLTALLATDDQLALAHIGDSRAYRLRGGNLAQLTRDHTLVQSLIDEGQITEEEALTHPRRSWIMRALDGRGSPDVDVTILDVEPGDRYLVCSDGLSSYVSEADIEAGLDGDDPQQAADRLVDLALRAGGPDNITCIVADPAETESGGAQSPILGGAVADADPAAPGAESADQPAGDASDQVAPRRRWSLGRRLAAIACIVVILIAGAVVAVAVYIHHQWYVAPSQGKVAVFQGVQGNAAGIDLSHLHALTDIPVTALPQDDRERVAAGIQASGGQSGAATVVTNLRRGACASSSSATPQPTPSASPRPTGKASTRLIPPLAVTRPWCVNAP